MLKRFLNRLASAFLTGTLMIFLASSALFAQETAPYCAQLAAADCAILSTAADAMDDVQSVETTSSVVFNMADIPSMPFDEMGLNYDQYTAFSIDPEAMTLIREMQNMSSAEIEQMMSNPIDAVNFIETLLTSLDMAVEMDLELSDGILELVNQEFRSEFGMDLPADLGLQIRFIDGIIYVDLSTVAKMVPEIGMFVQGWVGVDSAPLLQMARSEMAAAGIDENFDLGDLSELDDNPFTAMSMNQSGPLVTMIDELDPTGEAATYLSIEREASDDETIATFRTIMDYEKFMKSNAFRELLYAVMTQDGATVNAAELDETISLAQLMAPAFLQDFHLDLVEEIAADTGYMLGGEFLLDWDLKSVFTLAAQSDPSMKLALDAEPNLTLSSSSNNSNINEEIIIEVPEGAFVVPMEMLMALMNS